VPLRLLRTNTPPARAMIDWLSGDAPNAFTVDQDCELCSVSEDRATVRFVRHPLEGDSFNTHLAEGKVPTKLAMTYDDSISFTLTERFQLKGIKMLDVLKESLQNLGSSEEHFDTEFFLTANSLKDLLAALVAACGGELTEEEA